MDDREVDPGQMGQHKSVGNSMTFQRIWMKKRIT